MDEFIRIRPPYRLSPKVPVEVDGWPSAKAPAWTVWKYTLAKEDVQEYIHLEPLPAATYLGWLKSQQPTSQPTSTK
jgi:hypothetical protein